MTAQHHDGATELTWEEFLRVQQVYDGPERICWDHGRIVMAMTGGTERHDLTVAAFSDRLRTVYRGKPCNTFTHNRQIKTAHRSYYPDVLVRCGTPAHPLYEDDARFIIEVLSPSNGPADRTTMLYDYQDIPSIEVVLFVSTLRRTVTIHRKTADGWTETATRNGTVQLGDVVVDMEQLWADVDDIASFD